jgi:mannose-1-phosphate guanylyltransferase
MRHAVILAGGSGTRLWPASRRSMPKQLLPLVNDDEPMIAAAVALGRQVADRVVIVTAESQVEATIATVPNVEVIAEPLGKNTAAAIGLAGATIAARDTHATMVVLPADQHVRDRDGMAAALDACLTTAEKTDAIALVGIPPTRPETGFGYLEMAPGPSDGIRPVLRFVEKPNRVTAEGYLASGNFLWNAGIFCMTTRRLLIELDTHLPQTAGIVRQIVADNGLVLDPRGLYEQITPISFDHGVMEKTSHVVAIAAAVGWNDVGSWSAIPEVRGVNEISGNTLTGTLIYAMDSADNVIVSDDKTLIATIGVTDLIIVKAGDAILIARKDQAQRVKELVEALDARGWSRFL